LHGKSEKGGFIQSLLPPICGFYSRVLRTDAARIRRNLSRYYKKIYLTYVCKSIIVRKMEVFIKVRWKRF
jgi:hypothetical protein